MQKLAAARAAFAARHWTGAHDVFLAARQDGPLDADDLTALATASWWLGLMDESLAVGEEAYELYLAASDHRGAAMRAFHIAYAYFLRGNAEVGGGWVSRAQRLLADEPDCPEQGYLLYFAVETSLDGGEETMASAYRSSGLQAAAKRCRGAVLLATGRTEEALSILRSACSGWTELEAPYDCAKVRVLLARAYRQLGDIESSDREFDAARSAFEQLGAELDANEAGGERRATLPNGLTEREGEVLALVAAGRTNRQIADGLFLSQKTVARHVSNIFTKLGVTTRTAAARFAFEHGLASPRHG